MKATDLLIHLNSPINDLFVLIVDTPFSLVGKNIFRSIFSLKCVYFINDAIC